MYRLKQEEWEKEHLSPFATLSSASKGTREPREECDIRTCFCRDRDRIIHSKAFRRLKHKTQVFLSPTGDHYRTRLTHTLEVSQIARTIARALRLNEDLVEAISVGHDLGHTPFGHAGERTLQSLCPFTFDHNEQSVRVVTCIENSGKGLNLTYEVLDGILHHTGDGFPSTMEGEIVRLADRIAYINHDIDDAIRAGLITAEDLPASATKLLGPSNSKRINTMIKGILEESEGKEHIMMRADVKEAMDEMRVFLFENIYLGSKAKEEEGKAQELIGTLYHYFVSHARAIPEEYQAICEKEGVERAVCDYIAGMTDIYIVRLYKDLFIPKNWEG